MPLPRSRNLYNLVRAWLDQQHQAALALRDTSKQLVALESNSWTLGQVAYSRHLVGAINQLISGIPVRWEHLTIAAEVYYAMDVAERKKRSKSVSKCRNARAIKRVNQQMADAKAMAEALCRSKSSAT